VHTTQKAVQVHEHTGLTIYTMIIDDMQLEVTQFVHKLPEIDS